MHLYLYNMREWSCIFNRQELNPSSFLTCLFLFANKWSSHPSVYLDAILASNSQSWRCCLPSCAHLTSSRLVLCWVPPTQISWEQELLTLLWAGAGSQKINCNLSLLPTMGWRGRMADSHRGWVLVILLTRGMASSLISTQHADWVYSSEEIYKGERICLSENVYAL